LSGDGVRRNGACESEGAFVYILVRSPVGVGCIKGCG